MEKDDTRIRRKHVQKIDCLSDDEIKNRKNMNPIFTGFMTEMVSICISHLPVVSGGVLNTAFNRKQKSFSIGKISGNRS